MTTGSTSSASVAAPASTLRPMPMRAHEQPEAEQAVDDRRHAARLAMLISMSRATRLRPPYSSR